MSNKKSFAFNMRIIHRYLGFFLGGIMTVYTISGITLIFRDTDFLKQTKQVTKQIQANAKTEELGKILKIKRLRIKKKEGDMIYFETGSYNKNNGLAKYKVKKLPFVLEKMTRLHKAKTSDPLFFLNIFFALSLFFFVISSFWMFMPGTSTFKKGLYFSLGGIVLTLILLFL